MEDAGGKMNESKKKKKINFELLIKRWGTEANRETDTD